MKLAACSVLYNPTEEIFENIDSYYSDDILLIIVDNTPNPDAKIKNALQQRYKNLLYIENGENLGIATALNIACQKAIEEKCEWILTMDQDSRFLNFSDYKSCLEKLHTHKDLALIAANTMWHADQHLPQNVSCDYVEKFLVITSGNFLNLHYYQEVGGFNDELFIDMVDHEYCLKLQEKQYKIYFLKDILVQHSLGTLHQRKNLITRKIRNKIEHSPQRVYYITRNSFYLYKKYKKLFPKEFNLLKTLNIMFVHEVTKILLYEDQKLQKLYAKALGFYHFLLGKYGKHDL